MLDTDDMTPAYAVEDLSFRYDAGMPYQGTVGWSLQQVSFQVRAGETFGIIGPNGSGKTSLLKLLARLLRPHGGRITLLGDRLDGLPQQEMARRVAMVPQEPPSVYPYTVAEIVLMGRFCHRQARRGLSFGWESPEDLRMAQ